MKQENDNPERRPVEEELRRVSEEAKRQQRFYEAILSSTPDLVYVFDLEHRFTYANKALLGMWGKTWEEAIGKNCLELGYEPWHAAMHDREIEQVKTTKRAIRGEVPFTGVNGRRVYDYIFVPVLGANGEVEAVAGTTRDVTERKQAEEAVQERTRQIEALLNAAPLGVYLVDQDFRLLLVNRTARPVFGEIPDLIGRQFEEVINILWSKPLAEEVMRRFRHTLETGEPYVVPELMEERLDRGVRECYRWEIHRIPLPEGRLGVVCYFSDISAQVFTRLKVEENEAVLRTVTNEARVGLVMVNRERRYLFANQTYADILGLADANIVGKRVSEVLPHVYDQIQPRLDQAFGGERVTYELRVPKDPRSGEERFYEVVYEPRVRQAEEPYVVVVIVDITERKKMQHTLERLVAERTAKLQETVQDLEAFSYSIAHDMRAPLRAMQGFCELLETDYGAQLGDGNGYLQRVRMAASRLDGLIQDVLNYSKVIREELPLQAMQVTAFMQGIVETYPNLQGPAADVRIEGLIPDVMANPAALTQVVSNLLGNAVKFVAPGVKPKVRVWSETTAQNKVRIWFEDNGIGIRKEAQGRIFLMFQRLNLPGQYEGTGIGLAIVRKAVERMGGKIGVESEPGKGSRFWIELERADAEAEIVRNAPRA